MDNSGKGLILLLHGAPGVGKTSTAGRFSLHIAFCSEAFGGSIDSAPLYLPPFETHINLSTEVKLTNL